jgi:hypothetical protein
MAQKKTAPRPDREDPTCRTIPGIAASWRDAGRVPPRAEQLSLFTTCVVKDCPAIPFATLRTVHGLRALCLTHFIAVEQENGISFEAVRRRQRRSGRDKGAGHV